MAQKLQINVLGSGCANCQTTFQLIESVLAEQNIDATLDKIEDLQRIMSYGVMSTPAIVVNGVVVHTGSVPKRDAIKEWLAAPKPCGNQSSAENTPANDSACCNNSKSPCC